MCRRLSQASRISESAVSNGRLTATHRAVKSADRTNRTNACPCPDDCCLMVQGEGLGGAAVWGSGWHSHSTPTVIRSRVHAEMRVCTICTMPSRRRESARLYQWYERVSVTKRPQVMHLGLVSYPFSVLFVPRPREVDSKRSEYTGAVFVQLRDTPNCADCTNARLLSMRSCWPHCEVWGFGQG